MKLPRFNENSYAHFVTTKTFENRKIFTDEKCCKILLRDIDFYRDKLGFKLIGYVIMPDHVHLIVWWDVDEYKNLTISKVMHGIKGLSAQNLSRYLLGSRGVSASTLSQGAKALATHSSVKALATPNERHVLKIWQPSFYDFNIYSEDKLQQKLDYIHYNPEYAALCKKLEDWPWSSCKFYASGVTGQIKIDAIN